MRAPLAATNCAIVGANLAPETARQETARQQTGKSRGRPFKIPMTITRRTLGACRCPALACLSLASMSLFLIDAGAGLSPVLFWAACFAVLCTLCMTPINAGEADEEIA